MDNNWRLAALVIVSIIGFAIQCYNDKQEELVRQEQEEILRQEQEETERLKEKYLQICSEYNQAIDEYNDTIEQFNLFLEKIEPYNVISKTDPLAIKVYIDENFEMFRKNGVDFSTISNNIDTITQNQNIVKSKHVELCELAYKQMIDNYNILADAYNESVKITSVDFIEDLPKKFKTISLDESNNELTEDDIIKEIADISSKIDEIAACYQLINQITVPDEEWVIVRLNTVPTIMGKQAVKESNDPNGLFGKEGGYTSCVYFSVKSIDQDSVKGNSVIEKGTDAGGAVEVYSSLEAAKNRCDYLSQFDNTLLYSGSYVIVGTMVIRTSYKLSNEEQISLTDDIINAFTVIE